MGENKMDRHLWPGLNVGADTSAANTTEVVNQLMITRGMLPKSNGAVHWSIGSLTKDARLAKAVIDGPYKKQALVPASTWLDSDSPEPPHVTAVTIDDSLKINFTHPNESDVFHYVVYAQYGEKWSYTILNRNDRTLSLSLIVGKTKLNAIAVTAVDRTGNESKLEINSKW
jgi:hypothetical protein